MIFQSSKSWLIGLLLVLMASAGFAADEFGSLSITAEVDPVSVSFDKVVVGFTPLKLEKVQAGSHLLTAKYGGEQVLKRVVEIKAGEKVEVYVPVPNAATSEPMPSSMTDLANTLYGTMEGKSETKDVDPPALFKKKSASGLSWMIGYTSASYDEPNSGYYYSDRISNSGLTIGVAYDYPLFGLRSRLGTEYLIGTRGGIVPVTMDLLFDFYDGKYFGLGVGEYFTSMAGNGTGWRALAGYGSASSSDSWSFEIVDDYFKTPSSSFFRIGINLRYRF